MFEVGTVVIKGIKNTESRIQNSKKLTIGLLPLNFFVSLIIPEFNKVFILIFFVA
jgi:hypothetical protein